MSSKSRVTVDMVCVWSGRSDKHFVTFFFLTLPKFNMGHLKSMVSKFGISYSFWCHFQVNHVNLRGCIL